MRRVTLAFLTGISIAAVVFLTPLAAPAAFAAVEPAPLSVREPTLNKDVLKLLDGAQKAMKAGDLAAALRDLNLAASLEPNNPNVLVRLAVALNMAGDYQSALDWLRRTQKLGASRDIVLSPMLEALLSMGENQKVLDLYPDPAPADHSYAAGMILRARASAMQVLGDSAGATAAITRSLAILEDYDGAMTAGRIALMQGRMDVADAQADLALKLKPRDIDARMLKIEVAMRRGKVADAQQMAERLVAENAGSVSALLMRIKIYLAMDRADKAAADVERIFAASEMPLARYYKAVIMARQGDARGAWGIAQALPKEYLQVDPGVAFNVAKMAAEAGFPDSGISILSGAVLRFPYLLENRLLLADLRLRQKRTDFALDDLKPVRESKDPRVAVLLARAALQKNDRAGAQRYLERALDGGGGEELRALDKDTALTAITAYLRKHPNSKLAKKQHALLLLGFGEIDKARQAYEQLVREDPADGLAHNNLAWLVAGQDQVRALSLASQAVKADPASANFLDTLGSMQMNRSDYTNAVVSLTKALAMAPNDPEISYHLALALEASGKRAESRSLLRELVARGGFKDAAAARAVLAKP